MNKENIILLGGGGHCKSCIDVIEAQNKFNIIGIIDVKDKLGQKVLGYPVVANDEDLPAIIKEYKNFLITIGQIKNAELRKNKFNELRKLGAKMPVIISPTAVIARTASIGEGTIIMHGCVVNPDVRIGDNCIINTNSLIEHESVIGNNTHVATAAIVNGQSEVGPGSFLGSGSVLVNNIKITSNVIIGAGSVVVSSITEQGTYAGNPAKKVR